MSLQQLRGEVCSPHPSKSTRRNPLFTKKRGQSRSPSVRRPTQRPRPMADLRHGLSGLRKRPHKRHRISIRAQQVRVHLSARHRAQIASRPSGSSSIEFPHEKALALLSRALLSHPTPPRRLRHAHANLHHRVQRRARHRHARPHRSQQLPDLHVQRHRSTRLPPPAHPRPHLVCLQHHGRHHLQYRSSLLQSRCHCPHHRLHRLPRRHRHADLQITRSLNSPPAHSADPAQSSSAPPSTRPPDPTPAPGCYTE